MASITKSLREADSADLLILARQGVTDAFEELVRRAHRPALRAAFRILRNMEDAEDAFQDSVLRAFTRLANFRGDAAFSSWLTRITINSCLMELRKRSRRHHVYFDAELPDGTDLSDTLATNELDAETKILQEEQRDILLQSIDALTPDLRAITLDLLRSEAKISTLAENQGISVAAAKSRLLRARKKITSNVSVFPGYASPSSHLSGKRQAVEICV